MKIGNAEFISFVTRYSLFVTRPPEIVMEKRQNDKRKFRLLMKESASDGKCRPLSKGFRLSVPLI